MGGKRLCIKERLTRVAARGEVSDCTCIRVDRGLHRFACNGHGERRGIPDPHSQSGRSRAGCRGSRRALVLRQGDRRPASYRGVAIGRVSDRRATRTAVRCSERAQHHGAASSLNRRHGLATARRLRLQR
jgi:hypothetical protein